MADWPGRRRVSCGWISASTRARPGGQLSTMQDTNLPWDSPALVTMEVSRLSSVSGGERTHVVTRKYLPNVDMVSLAVLHVHWTN